MFLFPPEKSCMKPWYPHVTHIVRGTLLSPLQSPAVPVETTAALEQSEETAEGAQPNEEVTRETVQEKVESVVEGGRGGVERVVEEVKGEVERVAGEVREEKVREQQEAQMADQQLNWLKDSAQVRKRFTTRVCERVRVYTCI